MISDRAVVAVLSVVTLVWATNFALGAISYRGYHPSETINGIFLTIVGGVVTYTARKRAGGGDDNP